VIASAGKSWVRSQKRNVAGLMKSTWDIQHRPRTSSRKTYAALSRQRKAVTVASRVRQGNVGASRTHSSLVGQPYGAFVRGASFVNDPGKNDGRPLWPVPGLLISGLVPRTTAAVVRAVGSIIGDRLLRSNGALHP
jgi:hypothetical protein